MAFRVGMKVVCVRSIGSYGGYIPILKGKVLTIREIEDDGGPVFRFLEIKNRIEYLRRADGICEWDECAYAAECFRPVRTTSIEVFKKLLAPTDGVHA
jgi:hypothetical protein